MLSLNSSSSEAICRALGQHWPHHKQKYALYSAVLCNATSGLENSLIAVYLQSPLASVND